MSDRIELKVCPRSAEIARLREMHKAAVWAYLQTSDEWDLAVEQARLWHKYEQALVAQRSAMQSALNNLLAAIRMLEEIDAMNRRGDE